MGGAKETPRQKMISMMYIVLTALLALNVSKQILDAFVAIEANIQKGAITQLDRGNELRSSLTDELAMSKNNPEEVEKRKKIQAALKVIAEIDKETQLVIKNIDDAKLLILEKLGELNPTPANNEKEKIFWVKYNSNDPLRPSKLNLTALEAKDEFDTPMRELGIAELEEIDQNGVGMKKIWLPYKNYRKRLVELCGTKSVGDKKFKVVLSGKPVDDFKDNKDLEKKVQALIKKGNSADPSDLAELGTIYSELSKLELDDYGHDGDVTENVHWLGRTFFHAPMIAALASLSTLQYEILAARAKAVGMVKSRITTGEYSFNTIMAMAYPSVAVVESGDKFDVAVWMAAFDSDKEPKVNTTQGTLKGIKDGVATLELTANGSNEMVIKGEVGIANKLGTVKWKSYSTKVFIAQKGGGSIGLPLQTALYADWDNKITAAAGGANIKSMSVSCNGAGCAKQGDYYIARVGAAKGGAKITVTAKDKNDKSVTFSQNYPIKPFPEPTVVTTTVSSKGGAIFVGLPNGSVLSGVSFTVTSMKVGSTLVNGNVIPANALRAYSPGSVVGISGSCKRTDTGKPGFFKGAITIQ